MASMFSSGECDFNILILLNSGKLVGKLLACHESYEPGSGSSLMHFI